MEATEQQTKEYMLYQEKGGVIDKSNPLFQAQRWKEHTLTSLIEEAFEYWCDNAGWIYPLLHHIECDGGKLDHDFNLVKEGKNPVIAKAVAKIIRKINSLGMMNFYLRHPKADKKRVPRMLELKYGR